MTPQQAKELLPIITAFANGEEIEYKTNSGKWYPVYAGLEFSNPSDWYRIKPKAVITYGRVSIDAISGDISFGKPSKNKDTTPTYGGSYVLIGFNKVVWLDNVLQSITFEPL